MPLTVYPGELLSWIPQQFLDANGDPLAGGSLEFYIAGTSTPKAVYGDANLNTSLGSTVTLDASGQPDPGPVFVEAGGYKVVIKDSGGVTLLTVDGYESVGLTWFATLGNQLTVGNTGFTSGYTVLTTDRLVVCTNAASDNPATVTLPAAADFGGVLTVKNQTAVSLQINPDGSDTIDNILTSFTLAAASSPVYPTCVLLSDGVSTWWVQAFYEG